jgi:hypothetical protein
MPDGALPLLALHEKQTSTPAPKIFKPKKQDVDNVLYGEFGPPEDASDEEKAAWRAWKEAVDQRRPQEEIDVLREALEKVMEKVGRGM